MPEGFDLGSAYGRIELDGAGVEKTVNSLGASMRGLGTSMSLAISAPLAGITAMAYKSAGDFEQSMNVMQQVSGATADQMAALQQQALDLGASTSFSAGEAAAAMLELSKAGLEPVEVGKAIAGTMDLAAAGNLDLAQAATIAANAMNAFNLPAGETANVANTLAAAANASSADVSDLALGMQMASAVFAANGQSVEDLTAALAILSNNAIQGSDAGTSLKTMLMRLAAPTDEAAKAMGALGINVFDADGSMRGFGDIVGQLETATAGLSDQQRNMALNTIFGADAIRAATILAGEGADSFAAMQKAVGKEGSAAATAAARMKGLNGAIEYLKGSIDSFLINAALPFLESKAEMIRKIADLITSIGNLPAPLRNATVSFLGFLAAIGPALLIGSKIISVFGMVGAAIGALLSPIGLLVAAGAALVAVFVTDFMGVRTALVNTVDSLLEMAGIDLGGVVDGLSALGNYLVAVTQGGDYLNDWLTHLPAAVQPAALAVGQFVAAVGGLAQSGNLQTFVAQIQAIDWGGALATVTDSLGAFKDNVIAALQGIDWGGALETAGGFLDGLKNGVVSAISAIPWGEAIATAGALLDGLKTNVVSVLQAVDWGGALGAAGDFLGGLKDGVIGAVQSIDWGAALGTAGDFLGGLTLGVVNRIRTINWGGLLAEAGDYLSLLWGNVAAALGRIDWGAALATAATWLDGLKNGVVAAIQGIDWGGALAATGNAFAGLETAAANELRGLGFVLAADSLDALKSSLEGVPAATTGAQQALASFGSQVTAAIEPVAAILGPDLKRLQDTIIALPGNLAPLMPKLQALGAAFGELMAALQPLVGMIGFGLVIAADLGINHLTALFQSLPDILGPIIDQITATILLISATVDLVVATISAIFTGDWVTVWEKAQAAANEFNTFFRGLFSRLGTFMRAVAHNISQPIIQTLKTFGVDVEPLLKGIQTTFETIWGKIEDAIQLVIDIVGAVTDKIGEFRDFLGGLSLPNPFAPLVDAWNTVAGGISQITGQGGEAGGTSYFPGGATAINERGYEQVVLPAGARVYTHGQTNNLPASEPRTININLGGVTVNSPMDARRLGSLLRDQLVMEGI